MCGIAGYVGPRKAVEVVYDQLKRLEYRGYDSAGIAFLEEGNISVLKRAGKLSVLGEVVDANPDDSHMAIAHSRWATHGAPTDLNAHPHMDQYEQIALIHNGIIENYLELKDELAHDGHDHQFFSETDTEVAAHIIGEEYATGVSLEVAVRQAVKRFRGAYSMVVISKREPGKIVAARSASPLVIGIGVGENMLASDIPALLPYTREMMILDDDQVAILTPEGITITDLNGKEVPYEIMHIDWDIAAAEKGGYDHFMLKEIHEQPEVMSRVLAGRIDEKGQVRLDNVYGEHVWNEIDRVSIIACGTSYNAGLMGKYLFEKLLRLPTDVYYASEFRYGDPILSSRSLCIFISQSGETADSLAALKLCKSQRMRTLGIVNVVGSSIARECDRTILTQAGPEISVASTKAYTAQVLSLIMLVLHIAQIKETPGVRSEQVVRSLRNLPGIAQRVFELEDQVKAVVQTCKDANLFFFLGRGADAYVSLEGALKMKEIAYVPTQEIPAGEMKHGPLALITDGVFAIFGATEEHLRDKVISNIKEVQARGGYVVAITTEEDTSLEKAADATLKIPRTGQTYLDALLSNIVLQLLAYYFAVARGCEIDQPRNLAKSVTVE
ncbi:MAG: glutamine--fructose-6-phosphate transaminase (isomerizing) [Armatimonadetes bacterium]|nr:glutamine--fructose-6-phosphate transaminase (isomerizing) [Armatimonadota bacterium]